MDAAGGELWADAVALKLQPQLTQVVTDCRGILDSLERPATEALEPSHCLARTWRHVVTSLDGDFDSARKVLRWMPAHVSAADLERNAPKDSTGQPITPLMWRANRLVDALAKAAVGPVRLHKSALALVRTATLAARHHAALLAVVTHAATSYMVEVVSPDGQQHSERRRDSTGRRPVVNRGARSLLHPPAPVQLAQPPPPPPPVGSFAGAAASLASRRRAARLRHELREATADARNLALCLAQRRQQEAMVPNHGPTATERLDALRERVRQRERAAG